MLFFFQDVHQKVRQIEGAALACFGGVLDIKCSVRCFLLLQLLANQSLTILKVDMLPREAQCLTLTQAQKQAAH